MREVNAEKPGVVKGLRAHGELTAEHRQDSTTVNKMRAAIWSIETFLPQLKNATVRMMQGLQVY